MVAPSHSHSSPATGAREGKEIALLTSRYAPLTWMRSWSFTFVVHWALDWPSYLIGVGTLVNFLYASFKKPVKCVSGSWKEVPYKQTMKFLLHSVFREAISASRYSYIWTVGLPWNIVLKFLFYCEYLKLLDFFLSWQRCFIGTGARTWCMGLVLGNQKWHIKWL